MENLWEPLDKFKMIMIIDWIAVNRFFMHTVKKNTYLKPKSKEKNMYDGDLMCENIIYVNAWKIIFVFHEIELRYEDELRETKRDRMIEWSEMHWNSKRKNSHTKY